MSRSRSAARRALGIGIALLLGSCVSYTVDSTPPPTATAPPPTQARPSVSPTAIPADTTALPLVESPIPDLGARTLRPGDLVLDERDRSLYLTDREGQALHVFDATSSPAAHLATVPLGGTPEYLLLARELQLLFVSLADGRIATVSIDPRSALPRTVVATHPTGAAPAGAMAYVPRFGRLVVAQPVQGAAVALDVPSGDIASGYPSPGRLGRGAHNPADGLAYFAGEHAITTFDVQTHTRLAYPLAASCGGGALALDEARQQIMVSCGTAAGAQEVSRWDVRRRILIATYSQVGGAETIVYDASVDRYFVAAPAFARGPVIALFGGSTGAFITNVPVTAVSRAVAYDRASNRVYTQGPRGLIAFEAPATRSP